LIASLCRMVVLLTVICCILFSITWLIGLWIASRLQLTTMIPKCVTSLKVNSLRSRYSLSITV
jgi:hypothetical protein